MTVSLQKVGLSVALGAFLIAGCNAPATQQPPPPAPAAEAAKPAPQIQRPPVSINAEMVALVDHAGHALWDVEQAGKAPKTDAAWANIEEHATQLAAAGSLIALGGTGVNDLVWIESPGWQKWSRAMSDAGAAALKATQDKNFESLVAANGQLVEACEGCHKEFKPDLPSEGITHKHAH